MSTFLPTTSSVPNGSSVPPNAIRWMTAFPFAFTLLAMSFIGSAAAQVTGQALVEEHCGMCHAASRAGTSPLRSAPPLRRINEFYDLDQFTEMLERGTLFPPHPQMPLIKFDRRSARAIVNYLRSIQQ